MSTFSFAVAIVAPMFGALAIGVAIFSMIAERRNPPIGKFIECDDVRLHYVEDGNPAWPPVVLLHGNGSMIQDLVLSGILDMLAKRYRVICFDRPGFGYSSRPRLQFWTPERQATVLASALKQMAVEDAVIFGHSSGACVALALTLQKEVSVRALVLAAGYYFPTLALQL